VCAASNVLESFPQFAENENFHIRWIRDQLIDDLPQGRVAKWRVLLRVLEALQGTHFRHIVTDDESLFYLEY
jgi:hypothetical protein